MTLFGLFGLFWGYEMEIHHFNQQTSSFYHRFRGLARIKTYRKVILICVNR